jgi:serine/threonine-protein kinase
VSVGSASSQVLGLVRAIAFGGSAIGDERRWLQNRVALYAKSLFAILAALYVVMGVIQYVAMPGAVGVVTRPERVSHLGITVLLGLGHWFARRGERPAWLLHAIEGGGTILVCVVGTMTGFIVLPDAVAPELMSLFVGTFVLFVRAAIVPSSAVRTASVGLLSLAPLVVATMILRWDARVEALGEYQFVLVGRVPVWSGVMVTVTALVSRVIYGLQVRVREAMEVGQYVLERKLGEGGMGVVYEATHRMLRRPTAVKLLPPERAGARAIARFEREVVQTSRLAHAATVAVYDYGRTPEGVFYYAMELLEGVTLEQLVTEDGPQPPGRVVRILRAVAESLAEAHAAGLVHRDIKPANIMVCDRGGVPDTVKVLDFGLVKELTPDADAALTQADALMGTPLYLPPEAVTAPDTVDARSDLYMLGGTAYFLLTGTPVFRGASMVEVCGHHVHSTPEAPSKRLGEALPAELERLVLDLLAKRPQERPANAAAVGERLAEMSGALPWSTGDARAWWERRASDGGSRAKSGETVTRVPA